MFFYSCARPTASGPFLDVRQYCCHNRRYTDGKLSVCTPTSFIGVGAMDTSSAGLGFRFWERENSETFDCDRWPVEPALEIFQSRQSEMTMMIIIIIIKNEISFTSLFSTVGGITERGTHYHYQHFHQYEIIFFLSYITVYIVYFLYI